MNRNKHSVKPRAIVFLGAGASQFAGYRTFQSFDTLFFDPHVREVERLPPVSDCTLQLMREIRSSLEHQHPVKAVTHDNYLWLLNQYRQFCYTFSMGDSIRTRIGPQADALWSAIDPFQREIVRAADDITNTTIHHYSNNRVALLKAADGNLAKTLFAVRDFYVALAKFNNAAEPYLPIFTTNYDMLLEDMWQDPDIGFAGIPYVNGIPGVTTEQGAWKESTYAKHHCNGIHYYRLHGCVCWLYHVYGNETVYYHRENILEQEPTNLCAMFPGREIFRGKSPHATAYRMLYESMVSCECIIFVGFSFRDDDVMHLLLAANASRQGRRLKLVIINPVMNPARVKAELQEASTRSQFPVAIPHSEDIIHFGQRFGWETTPINEIINKVNRIDKHENQVEYHKNGGQPESGATAVRDGQEVTEVVL